MRRKIEGKIRFINTAEARSHEANSGQKGTYRFGSDSIVFTPKSEKIDLPQSTAQKMKAKKPFDPGMDDPKYDRGFHPYYGK